MTPAQQYNLAEKKRHYEAHRKGKGKYTMAQIVLFVLGEEPDKWWFTWELMGATKWGWLSHATHATLRVLEQEGKITKDYVGKYVVYTSKQGTNATPPQQKRTRFEPVLDERGRPVSMREVPA